MADTQVNDPPSLTSCRLRRVDLLGVKDPTELIKVAELRREAIK
jgi:hypothetical protein